MGEILSIFPLLSAFRTLTSAYAHSFLYGERRKEQAVVEVSAALAAEPKATLEDSTK